MGASVTGMNGVLAAVEGIKQRAQDARPAWRYVGAYISFVAAQQFASKGARLGVPWPPLSPRYAAWKATRVFPSRLLVFSGDMEQSYVGRPMGIEEYHKTWARFGSDDYKVQFHQHGTRKMPARKVLVPHPDITRGVTNQLKHYILTGRIR